jgi:hypothetical protein
VGRALHIVDGFAAEATALRAAFDQRFAEPRRATGDRFVWDYWHVPGQYTALRTPAWQYFPARVYRAFHERLVRWGRETLGCHDVSPPWLSCYVDGCRQELHGDLPHGPWAFVFSLTRWATRRFTGGETLMLREPVLDFWNDFRSERAVEEGELVRAIPARWNRLTVFDPRVPHGVRRVEGTHDPREGRLVVHGWFVQPRPFIAGSLPRARLSRGIEQVTRALSPWLDAGLPVAGMLSIRFGVTAAGRTRGVRLLSDTTRVPHADERHRRRLLGAALAAVRGLELGRQRGPSQVTLPLVFAR